MASHVPIDYSQFRIYEHDSILPPLSKECVDIGPCVNKIEELKLEVAEMLSRLDNPLDCMNMIDKLERLGISYHFEEQIEAKLRDQYRSHLRSVDGGHSLHDVALCFRLMRQHGYKISPDLFNKFKDRDGRFKQGLDIKGLLSLYEASHLSVDEEDILDEAYNFARGHLKDSIGSMEDTLAKQVRHALEHPLHKSLPRFESKHHIEMLYGENETNRVLVELAVSDFNFVQSMHQRDLQKILRWWTNLGLEEEIGFARIQPLKWFILPLAMLPEPQFSNCRVELAKALAFIFIIDDIYDVYGSFEELVLFTEAVKRWDIEAVKKLPSCMKSCFMALDNTVNAVRNLVLIEHGWDALEYLRKTWADLCVSFINEAKWLKLNHTPKADEYLSNGVTSSGAYVMLILAFFLIGQGITKETINIINNNPCLISSIGLIVRLWDDLGSSKDENQGGDDGSYIDYYLKEHHESSVDSSREHMKNLITNAWKKLNNECLEPNPLPLSFTRASLNATRMVQVMFQSDDDRCLTTLKDHIKPLLFDQMTIINS